MLSAARGSARGKGPAGSASDNSVRHCVHSFINRDRGDEGLNT